MSLGTPGQPRDAESIDALRARVAELERRLDEAASLPAALRASDERYRGLYERTPMMLHSIDRDGRLVSVSQRWLDVLGYSRDEALGRPSTEFLTAASAEFARTTIIPSFFKTGQCADVPYQMVCKDGRVIDVLLSAILERDAAGQPLRSLAAIVDVTARKRAERAAREAQELLLAQQRRETERVQAEVERLHEELVLRTRLATIGQLVGSIAHELRNPLGAIRNAVFLLKAELGALDERCARQLRVIEDDVLVADRIIGDLLEMSRGKEPHKQRVNLREALAAVWARVSRPAGVDVRTDLSREPYEVFADAAQLGQLLANLLTNAVQSIEASGRGCVCVHARPSDGFDEIVVRDDGAGVAPELRSRIFEPLFTTRAKGTGLGLVICRQIAERHGGALDLLSEGPPGAAFRVRLPSCPADAG